MINLLSTIIIIVAIFLLVKYSIKQFKKMGWDSASEFVENLSKPIEEAKDMALDSLKQAGEEKIENLKEMITPEAISRVLDSKVENILGSVFPFTENASGVDVKTDGPYRYIITDDPIQPFQITEGMMKTTKRLIAGKDSDEEKAKAIFDWATKNIRYDHEKADDITNRRNVVYQHSEETFRKLKGVCGEMSMVLIVMLRYANIMAYYTRVLVDMYGKKVSHACVTAHLPSERMIDISYYKFNAKHKNVDVLSDTEAVKHFKSIRKNG